MIKGYKRINYALDFFLTIKLNGLIVILSSIISLVIIHLYSWLLEG